jgi:signal transduction histidine kinase
VGFGTPVLAGALRDFAERTGACSLLLTPLVARERVVGAICYGFGPSERQHSEDDQLLAEEIAAHAALAIDNLALFEKAQHAIRARDGMLAVVSHDLRNPLEVIALALSLLEAQAGAKQLTVLERAHRALDRIKQLIDDLLDVVRIDAGTLRVEPQPMDVSVLLEEAYELHKPLAADKRIALVPEFAGDLGQAAIDKHRMSQVLSNLLGNAMKFTPAGGNIRFGAANEGARIVVYVADSGPGIAPENLPRVFDRFWQKEHTPSGVGLGLAIAKGIVEAHGGTIHVESTPGAGATFRLWLERLLARPEKVA